MDLFTLMSEKWLTFRWVYGNYTYNMALPMGEVREPLWLIM